MRILTIILLGLIFIFLAGCEGETRHDISTGGDGSMEGLVISPIPQTLDIATDEVFYLDWKSGYEPPATIHVKLQSVDTDGSKDDLLTKDGTTGIGHYSFDPTSSLPSHTFLLLTVTGNGETVRAMYLTDSGNGLFQKNPQPGGSTEHTINTRPAVPSTP